MRKYWKLPLTIVLGAALVCGSGAGCSDHHNDNKTHDVTLKGPRGKEKTYEVTKDKHGNVTDIQKKNNNN